MLTLQRSHVRHGHSRAPSDRERSDGSLRTFEVLVQSELVRDGVSNLHPKAVRVR